MSTPDAFPRLIKVITYDDKKTLLEKFFFVAEKNSIEIVSRDVSIENGIPRIFQFSRYRQAYLNPKRNLHSLLHED